MALTVTGEVDEHAWWKEHPDPQVTRTQDRLVLWNYPVSKTALADTHAAALRAFLQDLFLGPAQTGSTVSICGHASATGEASTNEALAHERAANVAKYLRGFGFEKLEVTSAGASQPADPAPSGQALARNRRVEVTRYAATIEPPPRQPVDPFTPTPKPGQPPAPPPGVGGYFEAGFDFPLGEFEEGDLSAKFTAIGKAKVKVARGDPKNAEGLVLSGGKLSPEFKAQLAEKLDLKLGIDPGGKGKPRTAKVSVEGEVWGFPVEVGFQTDRHFILMEVTLGTVKVPDIELGNVTFSLEVELTVLVEFGPSKAAIARTALLTGLTVGEGAAAAGVLVVAAVIIGGTIYASESAKQKFADLIVDTATRDGAASRVAFEALGADQAALAALDQHRLDLYKVGRETSLTGFESGRKMVEAYLGSLGEKSAPTIQAWTEKFAKNSNATDFDVIRNKILLLLDPYQNDPKPLEPLIAAL
jgi:OmpA family